MPRGTSLEEGLDGHAARLGHQLSTRGGNEAIIVATRLVAGLPASPYRHRSYSSKPNVEHTLSQIALRPDQSRSGLALGAACQAFTCWKKRSRTRFFPCTSP